MAKDGLPSLHIYPGDWFKDPAVQSCSWQAKGIWLQMLLVMHECEPYGHLTQNGGPMAPPKIAQILSIGEKKLKSILIELKQSDVFSTTDDGTIYCRRLVRDDEYRKECQINGRKGGNPNLLKKKKKRVKGGDNQGGYPLSEDENEDEIESKEYTYSCLLRDLILEQNPSHLRKADMKEWAEHIDLMYRVDKRSYDDIEKIIRWCQADNFWQANIRSTSKLREKFEMLQAQMNRPKKEDEFI